MGDHNDQLEAALRARVDGEVRFDDQALAAYSTDGSNFRQVPMGVVVPASIEAGAEAVRVCAEQGVPLLSRGGGTSLAGQCTNHAVVIDWTKHCNKLVSVDPERRTCVVEPGIVLDDLNRQLSEHDLRYGPEPATHPNCTLGGMIGNNSCGATAQRSGKVSDNIVRLEVMLPDGTRFWCGPTSEEEYADIERRGDPRAAVYRKLRALRDAYADDIREGFPQIPRRVSGYNLDQLLPEKDFHVARALVGSESTLVTVLHAELDLIPVLHERVLVVLGFDSIVDAARAVPDVLPFEPIALEGVDHYLVRDERIKHMHGVTLDSLPDGDGFLMVQFGGNDKEEVEQRAKAMVEALQKSEHSPSADVLDDPQKEDQFWAVREAGLGATAHVPGHPDTFEGWEDSAVPVERLGDYLDDLYHLYDEFGYLNDTGPSLYGHFGQGCVHTRIPFDLFTADGVRTYRRFMESAARLVTSYGGSLSGEHGDGQSRGELLTIMFGERLVGAFEEMKAIFDPGNRMNPGKVVHPAKLDQHLRMGADWSPHQKQRLWFAYPEDDGSFVQAAQRCVGVGKCRQHSNEGHQVMCPSYQVTGDEQHSTRGRARLLYEMLNGHPDGTIKDGWRSEEVRDALDLCLACKGCKTDCPVSTDMATYKAEFLAHHYEGRLRPRADYALGYLPTMSRLVQTAGLAPLANRLSAVPALRRLATRSAGLEDRTIPKFATQSLQDWWKDRPRVTGDRGTVVLWPDTFTNRFEPAIGKAAVEVMEDAGWTVEIPTEPLCCGLTWISTGQLKTARKQLRHGADVVSDHLHRGDLVVGLEPSCTAALRSDGPDLLSEDLDVKKLAASTVTFAELLREHTPGWQAPQVPHDKALAQVHCHQHAIMGWDDDQELLKDAGVDAEHLESGCCGLAGNFGFTAGHGQVSHDLAHRVLVPRVNEADEGTAILADGFSCRTQIREYADASRRPVHLAELIAEGLHARDGR
ncbi:MAG TPA: FAD-binding and (Fe-S)-binding domain-containing protein [Marmoricola sp.]|nr:FAD-binding and (Fe-S)-binding domain-containing protein [Marmoricola sp.]